MAEVAPLVRRKVDVHPEGQYPELGIRSFGRGTFHKPALGGLEVGTKKLFHIEPGDLIFSNVFAWEGGVAVAKPFDTGRFGSHRFITCVSKKGVATPTFLCFYFLTEEGLAKLGTASPGGAGRNRTLGIDALSRIQVPVPDYNQQLWFDLLQAKVDVLMRFQEETAAELDALMPSILSKAFSGEL
jgi:type I restriction enzyme S subunit